MYLVMASQETEPLFTSNYRALCRDFGTKPRITSSQRKFILYEILCIKHSIAIRTLPNSLKDLFDVEEKVERITAGLYNLLDSYLESYRFRGIFNKFTVKLNSTETIKKYLEVASDNSGDEIILFANSIARHFVQPAGAYLLMQNYALTWCPIFVENVGLCINKALE